MFPKFLVVIGTSAGGLQALQLLLPQLTLDLDAAFLIVMHMSRKGTGTGILNKLQQYSSLPCRFGASGNLIEKGVIYLAPPNHHMLVEAGSIITGKGAPENRWRPSINNLFRSAAATYNSRVIGIVLTGLLDDGTAGMRAIKSAGGTTIIQDPAEAEYPDMPLSVKQSIAVDHTAVLENIGHLLVELCSRPAPAPVEVPSIVQLETALDRRVSTRIDHLAQFEKINVSCPDCGGGLHVTQAENPRRYRCHVGHSYTDKDLIVRMSEVMENTLWIALRMMEEKRFLLSNLMAKYEDKSYKATGITLYGERVAEMDIHIENLKGLIFTANQTDKQD